MRTMRAGRPPHQREGMVAELRRRIVGGELPPGSRLPSRLTLTQQFNSAIPTVQDAVQCLIRDGFVETQGTRGTYVVAHPPHLCTYGLAVSRTHPTRFLTAIRRAAEIVFSSERHRLRVYQSEPNDPTHPATRQFVDDVVHHRIAGVILTWTMEELSGSPLYARDCEVPRVFMNGRPSDMSVPTLIFDTKA